MRPILTPLSNPSSGNDLRGVIHSDPALGKVFAGQLSVKEFLTNEQHLGSKATLIDLFDKACPEIKSLKFGKDNLVAAWITKLRFNEEMTDKQFADHINRAEQIFFPTGDISLDLANGQHDANDNISMQWGIEALNGVQSYDSGVTRVRFPDGQGPKIFNAFVDAGAKARASTHAQGTRIKEGVGKDVVSEEDRKFTPRGAGHLLVIATSKDGSSDPKDHDLLFKREDYGYGDKASHTVRHVMGGLKKAAFYSELINKKSPLAKSAIELHGKGPKIHRKEHLSELKGQYRNLINLLESGKKEGYFKDYKTKWCIRIKWPPFEKKIVSSDGTQKKGIGDFLKELQEKSEDQTFRSQNSKDIDAVSSLLTQAKNNTNPLANCREGNEVLVDCTGGSAALLEEINKPSDNSPTERMPIDGLITGELTKEVRKDLDDSDVQLILSGALPCEEVVDDESRSSPDNCMTGKPLV